MDRHGPIGLGAVVGRFGLRQPKKTANSTIMLGYRGWIMLALALSKPMLAG